MTVAGSSAGGSGGHGAIVTGAVRLTKGTVLHLLIGQKGLKESSATGGGGGTFVVFSDDTLLAAAGGGHVNDKHILAEFDITFLHHGRSVSSEVCSPILILF